MIQRPLRNTKKQQAYHGFTIVEIIMVISIIGILAVIGVVSYNGWQRSTITTQLKSDLNGVAAAYESAITFNNAYPKADVNTVFTASSGSVLSGGSSDGATYCVDAASAKDATLHFYIDNTASRQGAQTETCASREVNYTLTIVAGTGGTVNSGGSYASGSTPTITATPNANYVFNNWTGDAGCSGTASHTITMNATISCTANFTYTSNYTLTLAAGTGGTVNSGGTYSPGSTPTITATPNTYYSFSSWTGDTGCSGVASHTINMNAAKSCTANFTATPIATPSAPTVTANTVGVTTTWSWGAASCPGNTARYQYDYTYSPGGYDSGWTAYASTSVPFTTSTEGQTYTVQVQAQCYNTATSSAWSVSGSDSYYRPIVDPNWLAIGTQVWAKANLNVGTMVTGVTAQTNNTILEKYCYSDTESNCTTYGGLYQWDEAMQYVTTESAQGICPAGSHIPSDNDLKILEMQLGMTQAAADATGYRGTDQGTQLKSGGSSGLNMPLAGNRHTDASFNSLSSVGYLWSSSESSTSAWGRRLTSGNATVVRYPYFKGNGFSVRCLEN